jgi:hypothetical protein
MTAADTSQPAGGAAIGEIVLATGMATVVTIALLVLGMGHRSGRVAVLGRLAAFSERVSGLPGWAALPAGLATGSLLTAVFGMYWDIALHIGVGRDEGPLANPAHYFILIGLFGIFAAGFIAMVLPRKDEDPGPTSVRIAEGWRAPLGGVLVCACGAFALLGFPLDDLWHRLFGQDVTLWGPTHLMLIGGASMTLIGMGVLLVEGMRASEHELSWTVKTRRVALTGGLLIGLSTFQAEFDFGVPQFRFVFQPMLIMLAAGVGLVATRIWAGKGAALGAVGFFIVVRGGLTLIVGPGLGEAMPHFPLYVVEALIVEAVALRIASDRPLAIGVWSGLGIGTIGLASEWAWSHVFMPLPWTAELFPEGALLGFAMAMAGALIGAWVGARLAADEVARPPALRTAAAVGAAVVAVLTVFALYKPAVEDTRAQVTLSEVQGEESGRHVQATVRFDPPDAADGAEWLTVTAWQGDGLVVDPLEEVGAGVYRTTEPIPVFGTWKSLIRMHRGNTLSVVPIFLPEDTEIPAKEVPAQQSFTRTFVADHEILQRESKAGNPIVTVLAYGVVAGIALALLALLAWGLHRLGATSRREDSPPASPTGRFERTGPQPAAPVPS